MNLIKIGIIGGTGIYDPRLLENLQTTVQKTPYGDVSVATGSYQGIEAAFIPRHGARHSLPPHLINYRANIMALKQMGVERILATAAVGSIHYDFKPGHFVLADQFLDFTKSRTNTYYEGGSQGVVHCDMTIPYCSDLRQALSQAGSDLGVTVHNGGVYVCTEGPRFETAAEIQMFKLMGGHIVGMTSVPEVVLARELGMCYANVSLVTNFAAGLVTGMLTHSEVLEVMAESLHQVRAVLMGALPYIAAERPCDCARAVPDMDITK
ncbi:MAG TPA: S-methyl-5'-thioadenosine phosphorylase [Syntrophomonadaceae bacterium]|nr:S-methyl-5'-thioadenosine phosphorylase [Syntrophomonadaceae bacterium]